MDPLEDSGILGRLWGLECSPRISGEPQGGGGRQTALWLSLHLGVCPGRPRSPSRCVFENVLERYQVQNASLVAWSIGRSQTGRGHDMLVFVS